MRAAKWRLTLRVITALIWIVSVIWLVTEPGFEPLIGFLGGLIPLIASLTESDSARSTDWRADIARRNREILLKRLQQDSEAMLQDPLQEVQRVALGMEPQPDAVNPLAAMPRLTDDADQPLRPGITIAQVFEGCQDGLLILGAPGAGKTTLLHELAIELIKRAGYTDHAAIPVIFNLASWAQEQKSLQEWLVDEFALRFQNRAYGQELVDGNALLLLLDGLDEVRADARAACVNAINAYRAADRGFVQIVVCARQTEYAEVQEHVSLALDSAVLLQPLTDAQVDKYLAQGGERLAALRDVIADDAQLRDWAHTPLWLSVMTVAYADQSVEDVQVLMGDGAGRARLFAQYVQRMFVHKNVRDETERKQILHWLAWLAHQMRKRNQTEFYIEELQPDWLSFDAFQTYFQALRWSAGLLMVVIEFLIIAAPIGSIAGILVGVAARLIGGTSAGLIWGKVAGLTIWIVAGLQFTSQDINYLNLRGTLKIQTVEQLSFSRAAYRHAIYKSFRFENRYLILFAVTAGFAGTIAWGIPLGVILGLVAGLLIALGTFHSAITRSPLATKSIPNQGILRSWRTTLVGGLAGIPAGMGSGLIVGLATGIAFGIEVAVVAVLSMPFFIVLGSGIWSYGGLAIIQHLWLRHFLHRAGVAPKNYAAFLTRCTDLIFMRREGGGFRFYHLELRNYFADLYAQDDTQSER